ncbi:hypothetical protein CP8484711_1653B, partial [Chlamydia psittaci 84-8471/1]
VIAFRIKEQTHNCRTSICQGRRLTGAQSSIEIL